METLFAPAQRADRKTLNTQIQSLGHNPVMNTLLDIVSGLLVVLNENRQNGNQPREEICALTSDRDGAVNDISLLIKAKPVTIDGFRWILIFARDITRQQFWVNLERVFFHDISNILSALHGNASFLAEDLPDNKYAGQILNTTERLWNELLFQKSLSQHKDARSLLKKNQTCLDDIQREFNLIVTAHPSATNKSIQQVWSDSVIPEDIQLRIFQRHFSTKASVGRGLGTYSMKLFGETYLKGSVFFTSSKEKGTTFSFSLPY